MTLNKNNSIFHVIIAGGVGSRFWPRSRKNNPKQLLKIVGEKSMIRLTYNRISKFSNPENIFIVCSKNISKKINDEILEIPKENFIIEPSGKNTAPAIGLAAIHILKLDLNAVMCIYPADHLIKDEKKFDKTINQGVILAKNSDSLITIGKEPTYPATGYGYIELDSIIDTASSTYRVRSFVEKPNENTAKKFVKSQKFIWNIGIFIWKAQSILIEMERLLPKLNKSLNIIYDSISTINYHSVLKKEWENIKSDSIDYGILENAKNVLTIKVDFDWNDIGSWKALFDVLDKNKDGNYFNGEIISLNSKNNLIISPDRLTAVIGLKDICVINLKDSTLIVNNQNSEDVKVLVKMLESLNKNEYL